MIGVCLTVFDLVLKISFTCLYMNAALNWRGYSHMLGAQEGKQGQKTDHCLLLHYICLYFLITWQLITVAVSIRHNCCCDSLLAGTLPLLSFAYSILTIHSFLHETQIDQVLSPCFTYMIIATSANYLFFCLFGKSAL